MKEMPSGLDVLATADGGVQDKILHLEIVSMHDSIICLLLLNDNQWFDTFLSGFLSTFPPPPLFVMFKRHVL